MLEYILFGASLAFSAAIQPGPLQAFLLASVAKRGWLRTLPASFAPLLSDGPIALLVLLVLNRIPATVSRGIRASGGLLLIHLAWQSYRQWQRSVPSTEVEEESVPSTLFQATAVNLLNPNPYLAWSLVLGPALLRAWHQGPESAIALIATFYATMVTVNAGMILLFGTARFLGQRARRTLVLASAVTLAILGLYQLLSSLLLTRVG